MSLPDIISFFTTVFVLTYALLILFLIIGWFRIKPYTLSKTIFTTKVTIIIPARNEEKNIGPCIQSILQQDFPENLFEIIVVDDASGDRTGNIVLEIIEKNRDHSIAPPTPPNGGEKSPARPSLIYIPLSESSSVKAHKKRAIAEGIKAARGELIITTDADCFTGKKWLSALVGFYEDHQPEMIIGPVSVAPGSGFFSTIQSVDYMGLMGTAAGSAGLHSPLFCSGANLAFSKEGFNRVQGYSGYENVASGDDLFLLKKFSKKFPDRIRFLKNRDAMVFTQSEHTVSSFLIQRSRWASKGTRYSGFFLLFASLVVYLVNLSLVIQTFFILFAVNMGYDLLVNLGVKMCADFLFLWIISGFYHKQNFFLYILPAQFFHIFYVNFAVIKGFCDRKLSWKGRPIHLPH